MRVKVSPDVTTKNSGKKEQNELPTPENNFSHLFHDIQIHRCTQWYLVNQSCDAECPGSSAKSFDQNAIGASARTLYAPRNASRNPMIPILGCRRSKNDNFRLRRKFPEEFLQGVQPFSSNRFVISLPPCLQTFVKLKDRSGDWKKLPEQQIICNVASLLV